MVRGYKNMNTTKTRNSPIVSVVIPTYNRALLINRAIQSVLSQTHQDFELIIVDDGSTDNTEEVLKGLKDKRIKYVCLKENSGTSAVPRNVGIRESRGDYVAFLDSDDEWLPEKIEKQLNLFKEFRKKNLGLVGCNCWTINKTRGRILRRLPKYKNYQLFREDVLTGFPLYGIGSAALVKRKVIEKVGFFDERIKHGNLKDMIIRISRKYDFDLIEEPLLKIYSHQNSVTNNLSFDKKNKDLDYLFRKHREYYKIPKIESERLKRSAIRYIFAGRIKEGRKYFLRSIKVYPFNIETYFYYLLFSFNSDISYRFLKYLKNWISVVTDAIFLKKIEIKNFYLTQRKKKIQSSIKEEYLIGNYLNCYFGHAANDNVRLNASSGGLITSLLIFMIEKGLIDGALVVRMKKENPLRAEFFVAKTLEEILSARGSKYCPVDMADGLRDILNSKEDKRFAIVGLPCHIRSFKKISSIQNKIVLYLGLFCNHTPSAWATECFLKKNKIKLEEIIGLSYRGNSWPDSMKIIKKNEEILIPSNKTWRFIGSDFFISKKCFLCSDQVSELADISFGDAWLPEFKSDKKGTSVFISRTIRGQRLLEKIKKDGAIKMTLISDKKIILSQLISIYLKKKAVGARRFLFAKKRSFNHIIKSDFLDFVLSFPSCVVFVLSKNHFFKKVILIAPFTFFSTYKKIMNKLYSLKARHDFKKFIN